jgi:hypothetical protein
MHPQYEHSPPTSSRSTIATDRPQSAHRPAAVSPAGPAPMTMTSKVSIADHTTFPAAPDPVLVIFIVLVSGTPSGSAPTS